MPWIFVALSGYSLLAVSSLFDKFLLSEKRIGAPALYAFFTALMSLPFLVLIPFDFVLFVPSAFALAVVAGAFFLFGLLASYKAIKRSEVSRAAPLIGVATTGVLFAISLGFSVFSGKVPAVVDILALALLSAGAVLLATGGKGIRGPGFVQSVIFSGVFYALSLILLKQSYVLSNFASGLVWSKLGMFLAGLSLLLAPSARAAILSGEKRFAKPARRKIGTGVSFFLNQGFGGAGTILVSYAVSLGTATYVQGMNGVQYGLVFLFATALSLRYPHVFREHISHVGIIRKCFALILLALGIWIAAVSGSLDGFL